MKKLILLFAAIVIITFVSCKKETTPTPDPKPSTPTAPDFSGTYVQADQMGRPAINTVFVADANKDKFNTTVPNGMSASFKTAFENRLLALNPSYTTNLLTLDKTAFATTLVTDVLGVDTDAPVLTFYDGANVLTGRRLQDDVIDVELILIFGGPKNEENSRLTSDHVSENDVPFLTKFPYLAANHK